MYIVGDCSIKAKKLIKITYEAMMSAIKTIKANSKIGNIGYTIQKKVDMGVSTLLQQLHGCFVAIRDALGDVRIGTQSNRNVTQLHLSQHCRKRVHF